MHVIPINVEIDMDDTFGCMDSMEYIDAFGCLDAFGCWTSVYLFDELVFGANDGNKEHKPNNDHGDLSGEEKLFGAE